MGRASELLVVGVATVLVLGFLMPLGPVQAEGDEGRFLILLRDPSVPAGFERAVARAGGTLLSTFDEIGVAVATSANPSFSRLIMRDPTVWGVSPDPYIQWLPADAVLGVHDAPSAATGERLMGASHDPTQAELFFLQWNMRAVHADEAWAAGFLGDPSVTVAILDTGLDPTHIDMLGTVDATRSASFVEDLPGLPDCSDPSLIQEHFPGEPDWIDIHWHGTHVGGLVAAQGVRTAGVAPHVTLIAVKVLNVCNFGFFSWIIAGILHAANEGADVINLSLGGTFPRSCMFEGLEPGDRAALRNACAATLAAMNRATNFAHSRGALVVAAAMNDATNADRNRDVVIIPAQSSNVVAVSATGPVAAVGVEPDTPASYTNFGHSIVDLAGPGGDFRRFPEGDWFLDLVLSPCSRFSLVVPICQTDNFALFAAGTSMATPHAAGAAALADSNWEGALSGAQLRALLLQTADDLGKPGHDQFYGHGRVNVLQAAVASSVEA